MFGETRRTNGLAARAPQRCAFTILELLVVMAVIIVLAGLILGTSGYVQKKGARSRAEAEIAAISAACESYKADNGTYPTDATQTESVNPATAPFSDYATASLYLYNTLAGATGGSRTSTAKSYFSFKPNELYPSDGAGTVQYIRDPFGNSYGYSTARATGKAYGYNPTFDLWSTAGAAPASDPNQWIKNW